MRQHISGLTCIHLLAVHADGLCPSCEEDYNTDPSAWIEFGDHTEGLRRLKIITDGIAALPQHDPIDDSGVRNDELPF